MQGPVVDGTGTIKMGRAKMLPYWGKAYGLL